MREHWHYSLYIKLQFQRNLELLSKQFPQALVSHPLTRRLHSLTFVKGTPSITQRTLNCKSNFNTWRASSLCRILFFSSLATTKNPRPQGNVGLRKTAIQLVPASHCTITMLLRPNRHTVVSQEFFLTKRVRFQREEKPRQRTCVVVSCGPKPGPAVA